MDLLIYGLPGGEDEEVLPEVRGWMSTIWSRE